MFPQYDTSSKLEGIFQEHTTMTIEKTMFKELYRVHELALDLSINTTPGISPSVIGEEDETYACALFVP